MSVAPSATQAPATLPEVSIASMEVVRTDLEMAAPLRSAHGVEHFRRVVLVRAVAEDGTEGWGECSALTVPSYSGEWADGAEVVLRDFLLPAALAGRPSGIVGHPMASCAVEVAITRLRLAAAGLTLAQWLGAVRDRVPCGVVVGITTSIDSLLEEVESHRAAGYRRVKLKVRPGTDLEPVRAVRQTWPDLCLGVDANGSYTREHLEGSLADLDRLGLVEIEQPFAPRDLVTSAEAVARLDTPICLDESIGSADDLATALHLGACDHVNLKPARVGGILEAKEVHDLALANDVPLWVGGMLETGIGKEVVVAFAALAGATLPGDLPASGRWYANDLTTPWELNPDGTMAVRSAGPLRPDIVRAGTVPPDLARGSSPKASPESEGQ